MKIQIELNNMEKSDLKWICKSLHIKCKISDTKQTIIRKLLNPMNKKYKAMRYYNPDQQEEVVEDLTCCGFSCFPTKKRKIKTKTKRKTKIKRKTKTDNKTPLLKKNK